MSETAPRRPLRVLIVLVLAAAFGFGLYFWLGSLKNTTGLQGNVADPTQARALVNLPGTIVVAQDGNLYSLRDGSFSRIAGGGWTQPAVTPDHQHLIAVRRSANFSDLYELSASGSVERRLTDNASGEVDLNHWSLYPAVSPDGSQVYYSYDRKYFTGSYLVDLSIFRQPLAGSQAQAQAWSTPLKGTGGDLQPIPLPSGGLIYAKSEIDNATSQVQSQIWYQRGQRTQGTPLSPDGQRCQQPSLSPDGTEIAMICASEGSSTNQLVVAPLQLDQLTLGHETVIASGLTGGPAWSPDGKGLIYFAPQEGQTGRFQLYYAQISAKSPAPKAVTAGDAFDAVAAPAWYA